jgi:hypothetical protein
MQNFLKRQWVGSRSSRLSPTMAIGIAGLFLAMGVPTVQAVGFDLGGAASYAVLYEGGGANKNSGNSFQLQYNNSAVNGNIGIGGSGSLQQSSGNINGNVDFSAPTTPPNQFGNITGNVSYGISAVQTDLNYVNNLSSTLGGESGAALTVNLNNNQSQTITASDGKSDGSGNRVFTVSSGFTFNNGATLTINGDAAGEHVVINFSSSAQFGGTILLGGGLTAADVLFNFTGGASLMGGDTLQNNSNGAILAGTFLDPNGDMSINHSVLNGYFFGGDSQNMSIVSGAYINAPSVQIPDNGPTLVLLGLALAGLGCVSRKFQARPAPASARE